MARILFKFIIHPSYERALNHRMVKSKIFGKSSLNFRLCVAKLSQSLIAPSIPKI